MLELEITPNRPDCLGVHGVAREVHAITGAELAPRPVGDRRRARRATTTSPITPPSGSRCRTSARASPPAPSPTSTIGPSPLWLKARLIGAGQRPINNVVDITNYVMLLTGQPLHAFDLDRVPGGEIIVRTAAEGERMTTLDDVERQLDAETVLVCDRERPSGIAGIMGGQVSEVSDSTTRVLLEAATWNGTNILRTSNLLGLRSEASTRFEKGLHPDLTMRAQAVASKLLVELCGARLVPGHDRRRRGRLRAAQRDRSGRRASTPCWAWRSPAADAAEHLERLGLEVEAGAGELTATIPPDRWFDLTREVDLIEEIARVHGLDENLPATLPERGGGARRARARGPPAPRGRGRAAPARGSTRRSPGASTRPAARRGLGLEDADPVLLSNPMSAEGAAMRTELVGGLLEVAALNSARGADRVAVFESGRAYLPERPPADGGVLGGRFAGQRPSPAWRAAPDRLRALRPGPRRLVPRAPRPGGLLRRQGTGRARLRSRRRRGRPRAGDPPLPAPGPRGGGPARRPRPSAGSARSTRAWRRGIDLPADRPVAAFEFDLGPVLEASPAGLETYEDVTSFPAVGEDIAVVAPVERSAAEVRAVVAEAGGELLREARVFDVYEGEQVPEGHAHPGAPARRSRAPDRTLTDEEVAERRAAIVEALGRAGGAAPWLIGASRSRARPPRACSSPGPPASPGRSPPSSSGDTPGSSSCMRPRARTPGARLDALYPRYRAAIELTELDVDAAEDCDAAIVAYPHGAAGPGGRGAARARACWSSTSPPTSGSATRTCTRTGTASWPPPSCSARPSTG